MFRDTNDGGAVNDKQLRDFMNTHSRIPVEQSCDAETGDCMHSSREIFDFCTFVWCVKRDMFDVCCLNWLLELFDTFSRSVAEYKETSNQLENFEYVLVNPAFSGSMRGVKILQQTIPFSKSLVKASNQTTIVLF